MKPVGIDRLLPRLLDQRAEHGGRVDDGSVFGIARIAQ